MHFAARQHTQLSSLFVRQIIFLTLPIRIRDLSARITKQVDTMKVDATEVALILIIRTLESFQSTFCVLVFTKLPPLIFDFVIRVYSVPNQGSNNIVCARVCFQLHYLMSPNTFLGDFIWLIFLSICSMYFVLCC